MKAVLLEFGVIVVGLVVVAFVILLAFIGTAAAAAYWVDLFESFR